MIREVRGDLLKAEADALVNTVNCVGVMGRGIALQFRKAWPDNYKAYVKACEREQVRPGQMFVFEVGGVTRPRFIINFPTKRHWKGKSRLEDIESGLQSLHQDVLSLGIRSLALPPLGCGLGGLDWADVKRRIENIFADLPDIEVLLYPPEGAPAPRHMPSESSKVEMTLGRAALVGLMQRYLLPALDPFVSLLEVHKLMYFLQEAGEPLKLKFVKGHYGPYAENLRHVLNKIEGHFVAGYGDAEDHPEKPLEVLPAALPLAEQKLAAHPDTRARMERLAQLIEGFETPYGLEMLATVHWVSRHEGPADDEELVRSVQRWNKRKATFPAQHLLKAKATLERHGWLQNPPGNPRDVQTCIEHTANTSGFESAR